MEKWNRFSKRSDPKTGSYVGRADLGQRAPSGEKCAPCIRQQQASSSRQKNPAVARRVFLTVRLVSEGGFETDLAVDEVLRVAAIVVELAAQDQVLDRHPVDLAGDG